MLKIGDRVTPKDAYFGSPYTGKVLYIHGDWACVRWDTPLDPLQINFLSALRKLPTVRHARMYWRRLRDGVLDSGAFEFSTTAQRDAHIFSWPPAAALAPVPASAPEHGFVDFEIEVEN